MAYNTLNEEIKQSNESKEFTLVEENTYELVLSLEERENTYSKQNELSLVFRIRKGLDQAFENRLIYEKAGRDKTYPEDYNHKTLGFLIDPIPEDQRKTYNTIDDIILDLNGRCYKGKVSIEKANEYHANDKNRIVMWSLELSQKPLTEQEKIDYKLVGGAKQSATEPQKPIVNEDDLPF